MEFKNREIMEGKHDGKLPCMVAVDPKTPYSRIPTWPIDTFIQKGKEGLLLAMEKGAADLSVDGSMQFNRDFFPYWADPLNNVQQYMRAPRIMIGEGGSTSLVPVDPLAALTKTTLTSGDTGAFNAIYGAIATIQVLQQHNFFGALPQRPYNKYGFRAVGAAAISSDAGIAEGANIPTAVEPTYYEIGVGQKELGVVTEMSTRMELYSTRDDTITFGGNAQVVFSNFLTSIDYDMLRDFDTLPTRTNYYNTESIDRITATTAARTALSYTDGDEDLYGIDRSTYTWFDSHCYYDATADREISTDLLDGMYADCVPYWGQDLSNKMWVTTPTTQKYWSALEGGKQRFSQATAINSVGNGIQPTMGQAGGYKTATYNTYPIVLDAQVNADTIGRVYLLDNNHNGLLVGRPIEAITGNHPLYLGSMVNKLMYYGIMELYNDLPLSCAQLRDLSS